MSMGFGPVGSRPIAGEFLPVVNGVPLAVEWADDGEIAAEYTSETTLAAEYEVGVADE